MEDPPLLEELYAPDTVRRPYKRLDSRLRVLVPSDSNLYLSKQDGGNSYTAIPKGFSRVLSFSGFT